MFLFMAMLLLAQDSVQNNTNAVDDNGHGHGKENLFDPVVTGNVIEVGSFGFEIPEGVFFADKENAHHMYDLAKTEHIPNCAGIFFSNSGTWEYCVIVQHFPFQPFVFEPIMQAEQMEGLFKKRHLQTNQPHMGEAQIVSPALFDQEAKSFSIGVRYDGTNGFPIIMKKVIVTGQDALLLTAQATDGSFVSDREQIESILGSPFVNPNVSIEPPGDDALSYLDLLGIKAQRNKPQPAAAPVEEELPKSVTYTSGILLFVGLILILVVVKITRGQSADKSDASD